MKRVRTTDMQIRGVPVALRDRVKARASERGLTMSQHVIDVLERESPRMTLDEWLDLVRSLPPAPSRGRITAAQAVREGREGRRS